MKIIHSLEDFTPEGQKTAVAIGNFDGVHLGHKKILELHSNKSRDNNLISLVLTFWPHPGKITGKGQLKLIQTLEQRIKGIGKFGVDIVLILPFTKSLANLSAHDFISSIVIRALRAEIIVVGENFRFGKNRTGNIKTMLELADSSNISVQSIPSVSWNQTIISSSKIRDLIEKGDVKQANHLLGKPFEIEGKVIKGKSRGAILGFPTANISTENEIIPSGVFITSVKFNGRPHPSLTNVGTRPTFKQEEHHIETHVIDFDLDLYGSRIRIQFLDKIRDEIRFDSPEMLSKQIGKDLRKAKDYFLGETHKQ